jgi:Ca-activated chloride channel family protein
MSLQTHAAIDRSLISPDGTAERHLMLTVEAPAGAVRRLPLNLALVLDRSGSMTGEKLERAKEAACFTVRHLTGADRVAVVAYDDEVSIVAPGTPLTPGARTDLLSRITAITTGGSTNLGGGWLTGCQEVGGTRAASTR